MRDDDNEQPLSVSMKRAAYLTGVSKRTLYRMHAKNRLILSKVLSRTVVPMSEVQRIIHGIPMQPTMGTPEGEPPKTRVPKR